MNVYVIQQLANETLLKTLTVSGPILILGMAVGLIMGVFQSVTSIQETTVAFVPKMLVVGGAMVFLFPWMMSLMSDFTINLFGNLARYGQ